MKYVLRTPLYVQKNPRMDYKGRTISCPIGLY